MDASDLDLDFFGHMTCIFLLVNIPGPFGDNKSKQNAPNLFYVYLLSLYIWA